MPATSIQTQALNMVTQLEKSGRPVKRIILEGKRIEIEMANPKDELDEFDQLEMKA